MINGLRFKKITWKDGDDPVEDDDIEVLKKPIQKLNLK